MNDISYLVNQLLEKSWVFLNWRTIPTVCGSIKLNRDSTSKSKDSSNNFAEAVITETGRCEVNSEEKVTQSCLTLCDPMDYTVHGFLQARILEWVTFPFSRGSSQPGDRTQVSRIAGRFFTI